MFSPGAKLSLDDWLRSVSQEVPESSQPIFANGSLTNSTVAPKHIVWADTAGSSMENVKLITPLAAAHSPPVHRIDGRESMAHIVPQNEDTAADATRITPMPSPAKQTMPFLERSQQVTANPDQLFRAVEQFVQRNLTEIQKFKATQQQSVSNVNASNTHGKDHHTENATHGHALDLSSRYSRGGHLSEVTTLSSFEPLRFSAAPTPVTHKSARKDTVRRAVGAPSTVPKGSLTKQQTTQKTPLQTRQTNRMLPNQQKHTKVVSDVATTESPDAKVGSGYADIHQKRQTEGARARSTSATRVSKAAASTTSASPSTPIPTMPNRHAKNRALQRVTPPPAVAIEASTAKRRVPSTLTANVHSAVNSTIASKTQETSCVLPSVPVTRPLMYIPVRPLDSSMQHMQQTESFMCAASTVSPQQLIRGFVRSSSPEREAEQLLQEMTALNHSMSLSLALQSEVSQSSATIPSDAAAESNVFMHPRTFLPYKTHTISRTPPKPPTIANDTARITAAPPQTTRATTQRQSPLSQQAKVVPAKSLTALVSARMDKGSKAQGISEQTRSGRSAVITTAADKRQSSTLLRAHHAASAPSVNNGSKTSSVTSTVECGGSLTDIISAKLRRLHPHPPSASKQKTAALSPRDSNRSPLPVAKQTAHSSSVPLQTAMTPTSKFVRRLLDGLGGDSSSSSK